MQQVIIPQMELKGNSGSNILTGNGGNDVLDGGGGADDMRGGDGNENIYIVDDTSDSITEGTGPDSGTDSVHSSATFTP